MPDSVNKAAATVADYDGFAAAYSASNESNLFNAHYARPEMIRLAGDVAGLEILDAGHPDRAAAAPGRPRLHLLPLLRPRSRLT